MVSVLAIAGCGGSARSHLRSHSGPHGAGAAIAARSRHRYAPRNRSSRLQAIVTAPSEDRVLIVDVPSGRVAREVKVPGEPEYAAIGANGIVVVSPASRTVTLLDRNSLRPIKSFRGFASPHIVAVSPDDEYAYLSDDQTGKLTVINLYNERVTARISVGAGAHHLAFSPGQQQAWVVLGQAASTVATLSTVVKSPPPPRSRIENPAHPHLTGRFEPGFLAHDVRFAPDGKRVWITSADTQYAGVFSARTHRLLFRVPAGPPPQHVAFDRGYAYLTSGYGSQIEEVAPNGRIIRTTHAPYGSFDVAAADGFVVTVSLFGGTLAIYNRHLHLLNLRHLTQSTEDVVLAER